MIGDSTDSVWGVMDVYPRTNFPDIRKKCTLRTKAGNLLIIPREGGSLVRFYLELPEGKVATEITLEDLQLQASRIFQPYDMEIAATAWWSAYAIGQRRADFFTMKHRVFLTGDACHTHSPKAGQGMNVSLQDGYNIGWKLAAVLRGQCPPSLLETYVEEREKVATDLIQFDRHFTRIFSSKEGTVTPEYFSEQFIKVGRYTAGLTCKYDESSIISPANEKAQELARNLVVGMRMPSRQVVRFCDAKVLQLARTLPADGRWRLLIFAGNITNSATQIIFKKVRPTPLPNKQFYLLYWWTDMFA
jgi:phenol 2-monooxygenase